MKKIKIILMISLLLIVCGCKNNNQESESVNIYATVYPVQYITEKLYGENNTIASIYPNGVDLNDYELTEKKINEYSSANMFVYVGLGNELNIAKSFLNKNKKLEIIDATHGLSYKNKVEELWIAPNNFLMLVKNIKSSLSEYINSDYTIEQINQKYEEIYNDISWMDAELRSIAKEAKENNTNTIVTATNVFKYLENYGFNIICLENITKNGETDIKAKFKDGTFSSILKLDTEKNTEFINELQDGFDAKVQKINSMITNSDSASDYMTIQNENINIIREIVLN